MYSCRSGSCGLNKFWVNFKVKPRPVQPAVVNGATPDARTSVFPGRVSHRVTEFSCSDRNRDEEVGLD